MRNAIGSWTPRGAGDRKVLYYPDTMIVVYAVEGNPADQQRALNHLSRSKRPATDLPSVN
jgi:hypothetical protein